MVYSSREGFAAWVRTMWLPHLQHLEPDQRPLFIDALYEKYVTLYPPDEQGAIHIGMMRLEADAIKRA
jgi:trans-aconitate 2-methyltransferase